MTARRATANEERRAYMLAERRCARCMQRFVEYENLGQWRCREHPGEIVAGRFTCCRQRVGLAIGGDKNAYYAHVFLDRDRGCIACDHTADGVDVVHGPAPFAAVSRAEAEALRVPAPALHVPQPERHFVCRYDRQEYARYLGGVRLDVPTTSVPVPRGQ